MIREILLALGYGVLAIGYGFWMGRWSGRRRLSWWLDEAEGHGRQLGHADALLELARADREQEAVR